MNSVVSVAQDLSLRERISIVTPCLNQSRYLSATIQSVLGQGYPALEYSTIYGGSTDGSLDVIRRFEPNLHFRCSEPDKGMYDALDKGFRRSSGEITTWNCASTPWRFLPTVLRHTLRNHHQSQDPTSQPSSPGNR